MKIQCFYVCIAVVSLLNLPIRASENNRHSGLIIDIPKKDARSRNISLGNLYRHDRSGSAEILRAKARRSSLPTTLVHDLNPQLLVVGYTQLKNGRRRVSASSLHSIQEESPQMDLGVTVTRICSNMNTSTSNALGRAISDGARDQFLREGVALRNDYLHSLELLSNTSMGQNRMMRQFLESYQCKCEKLKREADRIGREEKMARDQAILAVRVEANQKLVEVVASRTKWKRITCIATGTAGAFALMSIMQVLSG